MTELTGWEHSLKNELILGRKVHREHRPSRKQLAELLASTGVKPKLVRELMPELLSGEAESVGPGEHGGSPPLDQPT